jgi:hypothetical protein
MLGKIAAVAALLVLPVAASAAAFHSDQLGFSADFPDAAAVGKPTGSETDAAGKFISTSVMVSSHVQGVYYAGVTVDIFDAPTQVQIEGSLHNERDAFMRSIKGNILTDKRVKVDGNEAELFTYKSPNGDKSGSCTIVIVPDARPRIYVVVVMVTPKATQQQQAAMDKFTHSFRLTPRR